MVGVAYEWTVDEWLSDIKLASSGGIDGFALNAASESLTLASATGIANAYAAAKAIGTSFKLFISFDMTSFPCTQASDADILVSLSELYASHPNQATYKSTGRPILSTFDGSLCTFGQGGNWSDAFQTQVLTPLGEKTGLSPFFIPGLYSVNSATLGSMPSLNGAFMWTSGWSFTDANVTFSADQAYLDGMSDSQVLMSALSPSFYTHYGTSSWNKNYLLYSDHFLLAKRWEVLIANRASVDLIELVTWNDFGESSYIGPVKGTYEENKIWADGFDQQALLSANAWYAEWWKSGDAPAVTSNVIHLQSRPHVASATASDDSAGPPAGGATGGDPDTRLWEEDLFFALVFANGTGTLTMTSGAVSNTFVVAAGINHFSSPLQAGSGISATLAVSGEPNVTLAPANFTFVANPVTYNFNYHFWSSG